MVRDVVAVLVLVLLATPVLAQQVDYFRPVDVAPTEDSIGEGYVVPEVQHPLPRPLSLHLLDLALLAGGLGLAAWLVLKRRSRAWVLALTVGCVLYFGFYREGCVCPIGAIQNVTLALAEPGAAVPLYVIAIFMLPLLAALFFGRVFCSGVCPLGAIQELVVIRPLQVPLRLDKALGWLKWAYLGLALYFVLQPAAERDFIICRYDPFVSLFRFTGSFAMLLTGGLFLLAGTFLGRPYCRWLCPYGALLSLCSRLAWKSVSITPHRELDCGLCTEACPYGAIEKMRAIRTTCLACARCYGSCPVHVDGAAAVPPAIPRNAEP